MCNIGIIGIIRTYVESYRDYGGQHVIASNIERKMGASIVQKTTR